jgi:hypothetical protein
VKPGLRKFSPTVKEPGGFTDMANRDRTIIQALTEAKS